MAALFICLKEPVHCVADEFVALRVVSKEAQPRCFALDAFYELY